MKTQKDKLYKSYNNHYNPHGGMEASASLYYFVQKHDLTSSLEVLEKLGYGKEESIVTLASVQLIAGLGGVA